MGIGYVYGWGICKNLLEKTQIGVFRIQNWVLASHEQDIKEENSKNCKCNLFRQHYLWFGFSIIIYICCRTLCCPWSGAHSGYHFNTKKLWNFFRHLSGMDQHWKIEKLRVFLSKSRTKKVRKHNFAHFVHALRWFKALRLFFLINFPGPTFIPCPTHILE